MATITRLNNPNDILVNITPEPGAFTDIVQVSLNVTDPATIVVFSVNASSEEIEYTGTPITLRETTALRIKVLDNPSEVLLGSNTFIFTKNTVAAQEQAIATPAIVTMTATQKESSKTVADRCNFYLRYEGKIIERTSDALAAVGTSQGKDYNCNQDASSNPTYIELGCLNLLQPAFRTNVLAKKDTTPKPLKKLNGSPNGFTKLAGIIEHFQNVAGYNHNWTSCKDNNGNVYDYYGFYWCAAFVTTVWIEAGAAAPGTDNTGFVHNESNKGVLTFVDGTTTQYYCRTGTVNSWIYWGVLHGNFYQPKEIGFDPLKVSPGSAVIMRDEGHIECVVESVTIDGLKTCGGNTAPSGTNRNGNGLFSKYFTSIDKFQGFVRPWPYTTAYNYYNSYNDWSTAVRNAGYQISNEILYNTNGATIRYRRAIKIDSNTGEQTWVGGWSTGRTQLDPVTALHNKIVSGMGSLIKPAP